MNNESIPILNQTMELVDCRGKWIFDEKHHCWCLEDVLYTARATVPKFQRLSIFVPENLLSPDGTFPAEAKNVPVVFENNSAGYMQMPHVWLDGPRCYAQQYLDHGLIYVSCGCRGRESRDSQGRPVGKLPITLVDLKTAIRFLRHNRTVLPGDWEKIVSAGWSAGGAMSSLLAVSGDNKRYAPYLEENGAFMDESDAVFAAQIYCPIIDLEHADMAYEWMFRADKTCEDSPAGPAETMTPFKEALSAKLAARFWDIDRGRITVGGVDVATVDPEKLLTAYSIVFQDVTLFNNTVMENIRIGRKDATDNQVMQAAKEAMCDEFIAKLPQGYQTMIGENGSTLSGGERQRISIARALLKNAPIILLDEATASLDAENETEIQQAISRLVEQKTVLIIAHRMRTVENANKIVVLSGGTVAEMGTPEELMKQGGAFARMVKLQTESQNWTLT